MIDRVYGKVELNDPLAQDIVASSTFQRLRGVDQAGYEAAFFPEYIHSRYEHCLGVYALLGYYDASREEQVAGLIHDIAHTAFSHCTEYALEHSGDVTDMALQDSMHVDFVANSELADIFERHGVPLEFITDEHNFPLLERDLPALCADRIDYTLRAAVLTGTISTAECEDFLITLDNIDDKWTFIIPSAARKYARVFKHLNDTYWSGIETAVMFYSVGEFLKRGFELGVIDPEHMHVTDVEILQKLVPHTKTDTELAIHWRRMNNEVPFVDYPDDYEVELPCKSRAVDPLCVEKGRIKPLSKTEGNQDWENVVNQDLLPKVYHLRFDD